MRTPRGAVPLLLAFLMLAALPAAAQPPVPEALKTQAAVQGTVRVIVHLNTTFQPEGMLAGPSHVSAQRLAIATSRAAVTYGLQGVTHRVVREYETLPFVALEVGSDALQQLEAMPWLVTRVQEDRLSFPSLAQSTVVITAAGPGNAWARGANGTGAVVAVLDTGVQKTHSFFSGGKVVAEGCFSSNDPLDTGATSLCPGGATSSTATNSGLNCSASIAGCDHGTHVAGIAVGGTGATGSGVAWGAKLIAVQVFSRFPAGPICGGAPCVASFDSDQAAALDYIFSRRAGQLGGFNIAAVNMSLGGGRFTSQNDCDAQSIPVRTAIQQLRTAGIATVVASGNDGFTDALSSPACITEAISVGSSGDGGPELPALGGLDQVSIFSNSAPFLSLYAPGHWIRSSVPTNAFTLLPGTSMSAPHAAGAFAVMRQAAPAATVDEILTTLTTTGTTITDTRPPCFVEDLACTGSGFAAPRIDLAAAVGDIGVPDLTVSALTATPASIVAGGNVSVVSTVRNSGIGTADASTVSFYLSSDTTIDPGTDLFLGSRAVPALTGAATSAETTTLVIPANQSAGTFFIGAVADSGGVVAETDETNNTRASASFKVVRSAIKFSAATYTITEPATVTATATITVTRTGSMHADAQVSYETVTGTATPGVNYVPQNGTLTFGLNQASRTFTVPVMRDRRATGPLTVPVHLSNPVNAADLAAPFDAVLTIADADKAGTVQFSLAAFNVTEPATVTATATITVTRTGGAASDVMVDYATGDGTAAAGADYGPTSGTLSFGANDTSKTFQVSIAADALTEGDETVLLALSNPQGGATLGTTKSAVLTIKDGQRGLQFSAAGYNVTETASTVTLTVNRTGPLDGAATVRYSTSDGAAVAGTNYTSTSGVLTFGANVGIKTFTVKITPDKTVGGPKSFVVLLSTPAAGTPAPAGAVTLGPRSSAVVTIGESDLGGTVKLSAATYSINESSGAGVVTVTRSGGAAGSVTVDYATSDQPGAPAAGLAEGGVDYNATTGTLTFGPGETSKTIQILVTNDTVVEGAETFRIALGNVSGGATLGTPNLAVVTIVDNDQGGSLQLSAATYAITEPTSGNTSVNVTVNRTGTSLAGGANVLILTGIGTAVPGVNYVPVASTLVFDLDEKSKIVPITILADGAPTGNLTIPITLSAPAGGATLGTLKSAVVNVTDANRSVQFSAPAFAVIEGAVATIPVVRGGSTSGTITVGWTAAGNPGEFTPTSGTLTFTSGTTQNIRITTVNNAVAEGNRSVTVTLGAPNPTDVGVPLNTATLMIQDNDGAGVIQFAPNTYTVTEGASITVTATRTGNGTVGIVTVPWSSNASTSDFTPTSGTLTFTTGLATKTFTLATVNDTVLNGNRSFTLTLASPTGSPGAPAPTLGDQTTVGVNILDGDAGGSIQFTSATPAKTAENLAGGVFNLSVTRTAVTGKSLASGILVDYTLTGDTGGVTSPLTGTLTFTAATTTSAMIPVTLANNAAPTTDRVIVVTLSNPRAANGFAGPTVPTLGTRTTTTLTITDTLPHVQFSASAYTALEGSTTAITVTRPSTGSGTVTVDYALTGDTAGVTTPLSGTLTFTAAGNKTFTVTTADDGLLTGNRSITLTLMNASAGGSIATPSTATLTILDKQSAGTLQFASSTASVIEGGTARVTVTRTGANLVGGVTIAWSQTGGNATGDDYGPTSGTLTFNAGVASQSIDLTTVDDATAEGTESIILSLEPPTGGAALGTPSAMTVLIIDAQQTIAFGSAAFSVGETSTTAPISIARFGVPTGSVTVTVATSDGTAEAGQDYTAASATITFLAGETAKTFTVPILSKNASVRNGNRALNLALSAPTGDPTAPVLGATNSSVLTILDFRADLIIASVSTPGSTLTGKVVAAPSTVKNLGPVAAPAFKVGVFMASSSDPDALNPGTGVLVATQDVAGLAPGASASFPTQVSVDENLPEGNYFLSAVANFGNTVLEADAANNGKSGAPAILAVKKNLTKFQSASAAFSQGSPPGPLYFGAAPDTFGACDVTGSVNLTGTFAINSQQGDTAIGSANLTGTINNAPVQYLIAFTGTGDDNGITATLTSVAFKTLTPPLITGLGNGSFTGVLKGRTLKGNVSGQFVTNTNGACVFSGLLEAVAQTTAEFRFATRVDVSTFAFGTQPPLPAPPVAAPGFLPRFRVFFDKDFPQPSTVKFTGPAGSGYSGAPADEEFSGFDKTGAEYAPTPRTGTAPGGVWSVLYKDKARTFTVPQFNANKSLVVIFPEVTVDTNGLLTEVHWVYKNRSTLTVLPGPPPFLTGLSVEIELNGESGDDDGPSSGRLSPTTTSFDLMAAGFSPVEWAQVRRIRFEYSDLAGNEYQLNYDKSFQIQVQARRENNYAFFLPTEGSRERLLSVFVDVPAGSVNTENCPDGFPPGQLSGPPFYVQVQNQTPASGLPYDAPQCIAKTGSTIFPNGSELIDVFSLRTNLDTAGSGGSAVPTLPAGTPFEFNIQTLFDGSQRVVTSLTNRETTEFIEIPNPATPALKPSGPHLSDAKLGQNQTISWTKPTFPIRDLFVSPIVNNAFGQFCHAAQPPVSLNSTQATYKLPTKCFGQNVTQANVCIFYTGENGEVTDACWFFIDP